MLRMPSQLRLHWIRKLSEIQDGPEAEVFGLSIVISRAT